MSEDDQKPSHVGVWIETLNVIKKLVHLPWQAWIVFGLGLVVLCSVKWDTWFASKKQDILVQNSVQIAGGQNQLKEILRELPQAIVRQKSAGEKEDFQAQQAHAFALLEYKYNLQPGTLATELPKLADKLLASGDTSALDRANALFLKQNFSEAETAALAAKDKALTAAGKPVHDAIKALELAGSSAEAQIHYPQALEHLRAAAALTSQERDPEEWAQVQHRVARVLEALGHAKEAEPILREVIKVRERVLGAEHPDTLASRNNLATALQAQGKNAEAEQEHRARIAIEERVLGAEHPDTLASRNNLAAALDDQGKHAEAEPECRAVLAIQERVLGTEHPDVFDSCNNLALCLEDQKKLKEALEFAQRAEKGWQKALGEDHPNSKSAKEVRERIEGKLKEQQAAPGN